MEFDLKQIETPEKFYDFIKNKPVYFKIVYENLNKFEWMFQLDKDPWEHP